MINLFHIIEITPSFCEKNFICQVPYIIELKMAWSLPLILVLSKLMTKRWNQINAALVNQAETWRNQDHDPAIFG